MEDDDDGGILLFGRSAIRTTELTEQVGQTKRTRKGLLGHLERKVYKLLDKRSKKQLAVSGAQVLEEAVQSISPTPADIHVPLVQKIKRIRPNRTRMRRRLRQERTTSVEKLC